MKKRDKRGMELMINTSVVIVLAILTAVVLLVFWDIQTGRFSGYIKELMGKSNVDSVIAACNSFVSRNAAYEYCCAEKTVKYELEDGVKEEQLTCFQLSSMEFGSRMEKMECENVCE
ncbi:hypothetical protein A3K73_00085 [Candidatus Pacearchaeota archaeon RBG_13_36_9]|nr:MAG: hypothetical protein A3K73_00085 [Candidatus Pacearchaeota archaeon RBG_13_36_9]